MVGPLEIRTPLGRAAMTLRTGVTPAEHPDHISDLPRGGVRAYWRFQGLAAELIVTRYDHPLSTSVESSGLVSWGVRWLLSADRETPPVTVSILMPEEVSGDAASGELVTAVDFCDDDWSMVVGVKSDLWISREVEAGRLPASWTTVFGPETNKAALGFGAWPLRKGVALELPGLREGERAAIYLAVAWCPTSDRHSDVAPWIAVDEVDSEAFPPPADMLDVSAATERSQ